jgi:hypothetical protein
MQVNTLGNVLLSLLLLPSLSYTSASSNDPARLAFAASEMYAFVDLKGGVHPDIFGDRSVPNRYNGCYGYTFFYIVPHALVKRARLSRRPVASHCRG